MFNFQPLRSPATDDAGTGLDNPGPRQAWLEERARSASWRFERADERAKIAASDLEPAARADLSRTPRYRGSEHVEQTMSRLMRVNSDGRYTALLSEVADAVINNQDNFDTWSHALCHNFEHYNSDEPGSSFVYYDHHFPIAERLVDEAVRRALDHGRIACVDRILGGVISCNFLRFDKQNLDEAFPFRPHSLESENFAALFDRKYGLGNALFVTAATPRDFLMGIIRAELAAGDERIYLPTVSLKLLDLLRENEPEACAEYARKKLNLGASLDVALENRTRALAAKVDLPGVFVDVGNTLIYMKDDKEKLNVTLVEALKFLPPVGTPVTVFTGGSPEEATQKLREYGVPEQFLPVRSKDEFKGKRLEVVIDDLPAEVQGFAAVRYASNADDFVRFDPWGEVEKVARAQKRSKE